MESDDDVLIEELSRLVSDYEEAIGFLKRVGWPAGRLPERGTPSSVWRSVIEAARAGVLEGGPRVIAEAVAAAFPDNEILQRYATSPAVPAPTVRYRTERSVPSEAHESAVRLWRTADDAHSDVGHEDHLWDTGGAASLNVISRRIPVTTRGSTLIVDGRVRHKQRPVLQCPDCAGALETTTITVRFALAPDATAAQPVPGYRCVGCEAEWPEPSAMRPAHANAFGLPAPGT